MNYLDLFNQFVKTELPYNSPDYYSRGIYLRDRCTMKIDFGRITHKTKSIVMYVIEHDDAIMVVKNQCEVDGLIKKYGVMCIGKIVTISQFDNRLFDGSVVTLHNANRGKPLTVRRQINTVILDEPYYFRNRESVINDLYHVADSIGVKKVIMVGNS